MKGLCHTTREGLQVQWPRLLSALKRNFYIQVEEIQQVATVRRYLFTVQLLCIFQASIAPIIRST